MHELELVSHPFFQILLWYRPSAVHRLHVFFCCCVFSELEKMFCTGAALITAACSN